MSKQSPSHTPGFDDVGPAVDRRKFLQNSGVAAVTAGLSGSALVGPLQAADQPDADQKSPVKSAESYVKKLYDSFGEKQRQAICFDWDHQSGRRGLLRTHVANNWHITQPSINSDFFSADQKDLIRAIFENIYSPDWVKKIDQQLKDDAGGYGRRQNIAIFGKPGGEKFEFVMTGRHLTIRCDGNSTEHVAFGGPIFYGHAAQGFVEKPDHPGNVFWPQALEANKVYQMLDGKQRKAALVAKSPREQAVSFRGLQGTFPGLPIDEMTADQKEQVQKVLAKLLEPYRKVDQKEVRNCLETQGGLDKCSLAFYQDRDVGDDEVWDNWRLEGPSFVWYFRGSPHVHVWVNIADDPAVKTNT